MVLHDLRFFGERRRCDLRDWACAVGDIEGDQTIRMFRGISGQVEGNDGGAASSTSRIL